MISPEMVWVAKEIEDGGEVRVVGTDEASQEGEDGNITFMAVVAVYVVSNDAVTIDVLLLLPVEGLQVVPDTAHVNLIGKGIMRCLREECNLLQRSSHYANP